MSDRISGIVIDMIPISNENGHTSVPSALRISENGDPPLVGSSALRGQYPGPKRTLYDSKRMIGMKVTDQEIVSYMNSWPFDVVDDG